MKAESTDSLTDLCEHKSEHISYFNVYIFRQQLCRPSLQVTASRDLIFHFIKGKQILETSKS